MGIAKSFKLICNEIHNDPLGKNYADMTAQEIADSLNTVIQEIQLVHQDKIKNWATKYRVLKALDDAGHADSALYAECELMFTGSQELIDLDNPGAQGMVGDLLALGVVTQDAVNELVALKYKTTTRAKQLGYNQPVAVASVETCLAEG